MHKPFLARGRQGTLISGLLAAWLGLAALALPVTCAQASSSGAMALTDCSLPHPLRLQSLPARCGRFAVPEDRGAANSAAISLAIAVVPALDRRSTAAPLFLLAGGPGQAATDLYTSYAGAFARIHREHDIVLVDQRGTGRSSRLDCEFPDDWDQGASSMPALRAAVQRCLDKLGPRVRHYTTSVAVADLDAVRAALGYDKIALYGGSYGTRVAEQYLRHHADHVSAAILDGAVDPERPIGPDMPADAERALQHIVNRCLSDADCARAFPNLAAELASLRGRFGAEVVSVSIADPNTGLPKALQFNRALLVAALRFLSYNSTQAALLPLSIHEAARGNLNLLASQAVMTTSTVADAIAIGMHNSVICAEDVPFYAPGLSARADYDRYYQGRDQLEGLSEICKIWPRGTVDADLHAPLKMKNVPILLLSGEADPVTPPAAAMRLAQHLTLYRHLVLAGEGHGQLGTACMPRLMAAFLHQSPSQKLDTACLSGHRAAPFFLSTAGPAP